MSGCRTNWPQFVSESTWWPAFGRSRTALAVLLAAGTCIGQRVSDPEVGDALEASPIHAGGFTDARAVPVGVACDRAWLPTFGQDPGVSDPVYAMTVFDDQSGSGPALYAAGSFGFVGGIEANNIARWNGTSWSALGTGLNDWVWALTVFDDGSGGGPALYAGGLFYRAGGTFAHGIAKWDGTSWSDVGDGVDDVVYALTVFDDGSGGGPALYAGGTFNDAGTVKASGIAKWNGTSWSALDTGVNNVVYALTTFDDGSGGGSALYAGGYFTTAGGITANNIAKWNGTSWSALGSGMNAPGSSVHALTVFDDGSRPALYAGGHFTTAGGVTANHIAKWDGARWLALGTGMDGDVVALTVFDDGGGDGPALFAGGAFATAGAVTVSMVAKWNGMSWSPVGERMESTVMALTVFDDGRGGGPALYAGGFFITASGLPVNFITKWNGSSWSAFGTGVDNWVSDLAVFDDGRGGGPALYAGGGFGAASGLEITAIAKWNGTSWSALGAGLTNSGTVYALTVFDDGRGGGPALYAGGSFDTAGGTPAARIAAWNGTSWSALGAGLNGPPYALTGFDDGSGPALYAGGGFATAGGITVNRIAKWDGTSWSALDSGVSGTFPGYVNAMTGFDHGSGGGPALYAGGSFDMAGGITVNKIAKWDGTTWSPLVGGMGSGCCASVGVLAVFDDGSGSGPALYAGGNFTTAGGVTVNNIARWDGTNWTALGGGVSGGGVGSLTVFDDGSGPALYAGGNFTTAGGVMANRVAKWNGTSWSALDGGMISGSVGDLTVFDDGRGGGPALYAGGFFSVHNSGDDHVARWGCETSACPWDCGDRNGIVDIVDFLTVLSQWGLAGTPCDIDGAGIGPKDFSNVMAHWGPCP